MSAAKNQHDEYLRQFKSHYKEAFQSWFGKLARAMHGDGNFQEIRNTRGDGALDGFVINSQLVYQAYAPPRMDELRDSVTAAKIRDNFQTAYSTLSGQLKKWVFLHNHPEPKLGQLSAAAINELKNQHPAIGIEVLDIASLWEQLKELPSNKLEGLFGKALSADSLQLNVFYPLDTLLERVSSSIAFPSRTLFEKNLAFFLREEIELMDEIETALESGSGERLALLVGNTATGKTVMACNIGRKFQSAGCHVFYARLDSSIRFAEVWIDLLSASAIGEVLQAERFEGIAAGLYDIFKCDAGLGREVLSRLDLRFLEAKAKLEQFEKICQAMNRLAAIDRRKAEELVKRFNPAWLAERCAALPADRLGGCLSEMAEVNADFAKAVLHAHGQRRVSDSLRRLVGPRRAQALRTIRKIDSEFLR